MIDQNICKVVRHEQHQPNIPPYWIPCFRFLTFPLFILYYLATWLDVAFSFTTHLTKVSSSSVDHCGEVDRGYACYIYNGRPGRLRQSSHTTTERPRSDRIRRCLYCIPRLLPTRQRSNNVGPCYPVFQGVRPSTYGNCCCLYCCFCF